VPYTRHEAIGKSALSTISSALDMQRTHSGTRDAVGAVHPITPINTLAGETQAEAQIRQILAD
jgi:hypothetical protein